MTSSTKKANRRSWLTIGILALCCSFLTTPCRADSNYLIDVWTPYEGLPQSRVMSIAQTPDGYLWLSTQLGWLARFDGIRFDHFNPNNTPTLLSPEIPKLFLDDTGVLWISDIDGKMVSYFEGEFTTRTDKKPGYYKRAIEWIGRHGDENRFTTAAGMLLRIGTEATYENENNAPTQSAEEAQQFCQDKDGTLWCRTVREKFGTWENGEFHPLSADPFAPGTKLNQLLAIPEGGLWIATNDGLWKSEQGNVSRYLPDLQNGKNIDQIALSSDGTLWMLTGNNLMQIRNEEVVKVTTLTDLGAPPKGRSHQIQTDSNGGAWILNFGKGVWHVEASGSLDVLNTENGLPSDLVETWFEDREKNIWLGTAAGLVRLKPRWFQIIDTSSTGSGTGVVSISEDAGGDMWLGGANGLTRWRDDTASNVALPVLREGFPISEVTIAPGEIPGEVCLGTVQSGAFLLRDGLVKQPFSYRAPGLAIRVIRRDPEGGIWFGGEFGLFRWDGKNLREFGPKDGLNPGHIHDISFDEHGVPWIAKADDLLVVFRDGRFETVPMPGISRSLRIYTVLCGSNGNVWLGTVGAGLLHISQGKLFQYTKQDGLPSDSISQLLEGDEGYLWGGTLQGIFRVSTAELDMSSAGVRRTVLFQNYDHSDGLPTAECSGGLQPSCWKASDGKLWFSTSTSAVVVDPKQIHQNLTPPPIVIEQMRVNGEDVQAVQAKGKQTSLKVPPGRHRYEFFFTGLSFTAPEKVRFQWRLDGVDSEWVDGGKLRSVSYGGLEPGNYHFSVRASNNDGIWSIEPATVTFNVAPLFWQRTSVRVAGSIVFLGLSYLLITGVMKRRHVREMQFIEYELSLEQQRFRHKAAMEAERSRIAAELHDDLGANLTQIQWLGESSGNTLRSEKTEKELLQRIARKSREMVSLIDQIVWAVNPKNDTLEQLATYICNFAEQYFRDSVTRCRIDIPEEIPPCPLKSDVRHHLFLIAKEALHNVAKHASTDRVWLRMTYKNEIFRLVIEDRGRGFDTSSEATGNGLANMRNRAQLAGVELSIDSSPGKGTRTTLIMNFNQNPD
jgi:signal transduction histidine kinase/ligand-binding sensor domain-containing protein